VNPGFGGQKFIDGSLEKITALRKMIDQRGLDTLIEADGGIVTGNIADVAAAGCNAFVSGSGIFKTKDYAATIADMRRELARV